MKIKRQYTKHEKLTFLNKMIKDFEAMQKVNKTPYKRFQNGICYVSTKARNHFNYKRPAVIDDFEQIHGFPELDDAITIAIKRNGSDNEYIKYPLNRHYQHRIALLKRVIKVVEKN